MIAGRTAPLPLFLALGLLCAARPALAQAPPSGVAPPSPSAGQVLVILDAADRNAILEHRPSALDHRSDLSGSDGFEFACLAAGLGVSAPSQKTTLAVTASAGTGVALGTALLGIGLAVRLSAGEVKIKVETAGATALVF